MSLETELCFQVWTASPISLDLTPTTTGTSTEIISDSESGQKRGGVKQTQLKITLN